MNTFFKYHPVTNIIYFCLVIGLAMFLKHPIPIFISFLCALTYSILLNGKKSVKFNIVFMLPMLMFAVVINPLFNHAGETVMFFLPSGNPFTLEATIYGLIAGLIIATVICWFSCFNSVISNEKLVYLTSFLSPSISLVLSMTLRLVPYFKNKLQDIWAIQNNIKDVNDTHFLSKAKILTKTLSVGFNYALEDSVERADSMKSRGYGLSGRSAYCRYSFTVRDMIFILLCLFFSTYCIIGIYCGAMYSNYFPSIIFGDINTYSLSVFLSYFLLCSLPILIHIREEILWKAIQSKI